MQMNKHHHLRGERTAAEAHRTISIGVRTRCQDRLVPLSVTLISPHARERDKSAEVVVTHQPKVCDTSADGLLGPVSRTCTSRLVLAQGIEP